MARINIVDYEKMPGQANEMRGEARMLNKELAKAYKKIEDMHEHWYGKRYNELVQDFNNMIPAINEMLELVVTNIPSTLETIANNYAQVDTGNKVVAVNNEEPDKIQEKPKSNDVGMRFITESVEEVKQNVSVNFENAKDLMDKIETIYSKVVWESEASEEFKAKFTKLKGEIVSSFENIKSQFGKLMEQTKQDMENTENANTVK